MWEVDVCTREKNSDTSHMADEGLTKTQTTVF